jgi:hypothetical protein
MSELSLFFKKNKQTRANAFFPATKSLRGEDGSPLLWEIRPITTKENEAIQDSCMKEVPVAGKIGAFRHTIDASAYVTKLLVKAVAFPDLYDKELQDSYGALTPEELLKEMVDNPSEYNDLAMFVQRHNGLDVSLTEDVEEAKN